MLETKKIPKLTLNNPWGWFIVAGLKDIENRTWKTDYRGRIIIHANKEPFLWPPYDYIPENVWNGMLAEYNSGIKFEEGSDYYKAYGKLRARADRVLGFTDEADRLPIEEFENALIAAGKDMSKGCPFVSNALIGEVDLVDIVQDSDSPWAFPDCYHWVLKNPIMYDKPQIGIKGKLRLWY